MVLTGREDDQQPRHAGTARRPPRSGARPKFDGEVVAEQLGDPLVLRQGGEALVEEEFERIVIGAHDEATPPKIGPPVTNSLYQTN